MLVFFIIVLLPSSLRTHHMPEKSFGVSFVVAYTLAYEHYYRTIQCI